MQIKIETQLQGIFSPCSIKIFDHSELHSNHYTRENSKEPSHLKIIIISSKFEGMAKIARHKLVYNALKDELNTSLHALTLLTLTPEEANQKNLATE